MSNQDPLSELQDSLCKKSFQINAMSNQDLLSQLQNSLCKKSFQIKWQVHSRSFKSTMLSKNLFKNTWDLLERYEKSFDKTCMMQCMMYISNFRLLLLWK